MSYRTSARWYQTWHSSPPCCTLASMRTATTEITIQELDKLVQDTYHRPYSYQQQDGCRDRGTVAFSVPADPWDYENDTVPEELNGSKMGVSFSAWLARDPHQPVGERSQSWEIQMYWERNFYPTLHAVLNDLHSKGLLEAGEYLLVIDW